MEMSQENSVYSYLKQIKMSFSSQSAEQEGKTGPVWRVGTSAGGKNVGKW
jgi:hypothetical protein